MIRSYRPAVPTDETPATDDRDPAGLVPEAVEHALSLAPAWLAWDGRPSVGDGSVWTPHKALRRINDHLLDHLAEIEAVLAGAAPVTSTWHGRAVTLDSDWARFTEVDLDESRARLVRYAELYRIRIGSLSAAELDDPRPSSWTIRQIVHHVSGVDWYAEQVGRPTSTT
jgi:hypothetical protein